MIPSLTLSHRYMLAVLQGRKTSTIRRGWREWTPGERVMLDFEGPMVAARITDVRHTVVSQLTEADAQADGFDGLAGLVAALDEHYAGLDLGDTVTIITFTTDTDDANP